MIIGFLTLYITMSSKIIPEATPEIGLAHVLILAPFVALKMVQFFTRTSETPFSFGYLPKLPTLKDKGKEHEMFSCCVS